MSVITVNIGLVATTVAGTVDAITATFTPTVTSLTKKVFIFRATGANASTTPTFKADATVAKTIVKKGNQALLAGDIPNSSFYGFLVYDATNDNYELLNPATDLSDTIWKLLGGYVQQVDPTDNVRIGPDTSWGASRFEIYSNGNGDIPFFLGDATTGNFFFILDTLTGFVVTPNGTTTIQFLGTFTADTQSAGDNSTKLATTAYADNAVAKQPEVIAIACSDLTSNLTTGTSKGYIRMPFAMTLTSVKASVIDAPTGASLLTVDINEAGSTILSTKLTIDASEKTSTTATTPAVISDSALANDAEITIDIDQVGSTNAGKGLIVYLIGTRT